MPTEMQRINKDITTPKSGMFKVQKFFFFFLRLLGYFCLDDIYYIFMHVFVFFSLLNLIF